jgi:hypothetical protein
MKVIAKLATFLLLVAAVSGMHVLKHFDEDIARLKGHYQEGDTSRVFSIFMKMLLHTSTLYQELKLPHP